MTNEEALTVSCSVVKGVGIGQNTKVVGRYTRLRLVFPLHFFRAQSSRFLRASTTEKSTVKAFLFVKYHRLPFQG